MSIPALYTWRRSGRRDDLAPCHSEGCCLRCGRELTESVSLELDQRINEYHDFGVPEGFSQGWFDFGPDCAAALRKRAKAALAEWGNQ